MHDGAARKRPGLRWTVFAYLAVFCCAVLILIWCSQSFLLDRIYTRLVGARMERAAEDVALIMDSDRAEQGAQIIAMRNGVGIAVFSVEENTLGTRTVYEIHGGSVLSRLTRAEYVALYEQAKQNGGSAVQSYADRLVFDPGAENGTEERPPASLSADAKRLLLVRLERGAGGGNYAIFLDAAMVPVDSTAGALQAEIFLLSLLLVIGALCLARVMSRRVAAPITRLTEKAGLLAGGHYDVAFTEGEGYREIHELSAALDYAASELSKVDRLQKELIANISHDLRTPLTMIIGYGEMMRDIEGENNPENVQVIIDEAKRLSSLVNDLLLLSRYQAGAEKPIYTDFDLATELRDLLARYGRMLAEREFVFRLQGEGELPVHADRLRILQVVENLVGNAVNYSGQSRDILLTYRRTADGYARVEVIDRGEGIPAEQLADIWQRYYKVDRQHKRSTVGSGLGLSIVRGILEMHGARYGVESRMGEGSRFWFELPPEK